LDRERFKSKIRWYQCYEHLNLHKKPLQLYRSYHQDLFVSPSAISPVPSEWIQGYEQHGIDISAVNRSGIYRWDKEVLQFFEKYGTARFRRLAIWDVDWSKLYKLHHPYEPRKDFREPRTQFIKLVHRWLEWTQPDFCHYATRSFHRRLIYWLAKKALGFLGW
jgi:hypothetical protein